MSSWISRIDTWNEMVRAGNGQAVAREMKSIPRGEIPADQLARIANLAWRINRPRIGLRLLFPELRRQGNLRAATHPEAFTEYAACLVEVGALSEAAQILREVETAHPRAKFYHALLLFKRWEYEEACPLLEDYLREIPADYHQIVVRVNLAAADVVSRRWDRATELLAGLESELKAKGHSLLLGNCYEIWSQIHFHRGDHAQALSLVERSESLLAQTRNMGWLYARKWRYLNRRYQRRQERDPGAALRDEGREVRRLAESMGSWETLRELDVHESLLDGDARLFNRVYFGSPLPAYRERLRETLKDFGAPFAVEERFLLNPSAQNPTSLAALLASREDDAPTFLEKKLLATLLSDFYAPFRTGQIFSRLFEGDFYDLETSPDRIFQVVRRLRTWLANHWGSSKLLYEPRGYSLVLDPTLELCLEREIIEQSRFEKTDLDESRVRSLFGRESFSARELQRRMGGSVRSANRLIKGLLEKGDLAPEGRGRYVRFKLVA